MPKTVKAFEANDMEESVVHPTDEDDDDNRTDNSNHYRKVPVEDETFGDGDFEQHSDLKISNEKLNTRPEKNNSPLKIIKSTTDLPVEEKITPNIVSSTYAGMFLFIYFLNIINNQVIFLETNQVSVSVFNSTKAPINFLVGSNEPLTLESRQEIVERNILARIKNGELPDRSMPSGLIALVSAVGVATITVMAYVGLIVWRRYQE